MSTGQGIAIAGALIGLAIILAAAAISENVALTFITLLLAIVTYLQARATKRIEWLTGAMESHSTKQLQLEAKKQEIKVIWWDKTIGRFPFDGKHGEEAKLERIYLALPPEFRREQPSSFRKYIWP